MSLQTNIRNKCNIEKVDTASGQVVARAVRADTESSWYVGALVSGKMINILEVFPHLTEVKQRKLILDLLERLPFCLF